MDYQITWKYVVEKMKENYGYDADSEEGISQKDMDVYMRDIWANFHAERFEEEQREWKRRKVEI